MGMIEGISSEITYAGNGGIALFAAEEPPEGAITGSGNKGEVTQTSRIRWWIMKNEDDTYDGGITGSGWYIGEVNSPFPTGTTEEEIYQYAESESNLDHYFVPWNQEHQDDGGNFAFIAHLYEVGAGSCVINGGIGG